MADKKFKQQLEQDVNKTKFFYYVSMTIIILVISFMIGGFLLANIPTQPLVIRKLPVPIDRDPIKPNGIVVMKFDYCKNTNTNGVVRRWLVGKSTKIQLPEQIDRTSKGCNDDLEVPTIVPIQAKPDIYHFEYEITYKVNILRTETVKFITEDFVIAEELVPDDKELDIKQ